MNNNNKKVHDRVQIKKLSDRHLFKLSTQCVLTNCIFRAKVELLIRNGANPLVRNDACETPAHNAAIAGNLETLKLLVDKG